MHLESLDSVMDGVVTHKNALEFLLNFEKAVAFDRLGQVDEAMESIARIEELLSFYLENNIASDYEKGSQFCSFFALQEVHAFCFS